MRRPLVLWTALFVLGIAVQGVIDGKPGMWLGLIALAGLGTSFGPGRSSVQAVVASLLIVTMGGWWHARVVGVPGDGLDPYIDSGPMSMRGVVVAWPDETELRTHYVVEIEELVPPQGMERPPTAPSLPRRIRLTVEGPRRFHYGDVLHVRAILERPKTATNPGAFDYRAYLQRQGIVATARVVFPRHATVVDRRSLNPVLRWTGQWRERVLDGLFGAFPEETARLLAGVALGDRRSMPDGVEDDFRRAGISHLLAVSGMHVGFMAVAAGGLLRVLRLPRPWAKGIALFLVWTYVFITGARPPAVRAGVAGTFGLLGSGGGDRSADGLTALAGGALLLALINPLIVYDVSFQLSFVATGAVVVAYGPLYRALRRRGWPAFLASGLGLAVAAQWGVLPLIARTFYELSTVGLVAGLVAAPLVSLLVPAGVGTALLYNGWPSAAQVPGAVVHFVGKRLLDLTEAFAALPWASVVVNRPSVPFMFAFWIFGYVLVAGRGWPPRNRRHAYAFVALLLGLTLGTDFFKPSMLELVVLDVGQGDAMFIRTPAGGTVFVDGGGYARPDGEEGSNPGIDVLLPYLRYRGIPSVDVVVNTHPHEDHLQGLLSVLEEFDVGLAVDSGQEVSSSSWNRYLQLLEGGSVVRHVATAGDVVRLDEQTYLEVLHPSVPAMEGTRSDLNNNSVVLRLVHGETSALLTGDIETEAQLTLLRAGASLRADVVKVPHHGSRLGLVTAFYEAVDAQIAFITVGRNNHGHPSPEVIATLSGLGADVYRTDVHGAIRFTSDGKGWTVQPFVVEP